MQYVGQTKRRLKKRLQEHLSKSEKNTRKKKILSFTNIPDKILVQLVEEMIFITNSTKRFLKTFSDMKPNLNG